MVGLVLGAFFLRMIPAWFGPPGEFIGDSAYHARLSGEVSRQGKLPSIDDLSDAPHGRRTSELLPTGLYSLGAAFTALFPGASLDLALQVASSIAGALIVVPVYLICRALGVGPVGALAGAVAIAIMPAHAQRTYAWALRYDGWGSLLATGYLALFFAAVRARESRSQCLLGAVAGIALTASAFVWRVPLMLPLILSGAAMLWALVRGAVPAMRNAGTAAMLVATLGLLLIPYVRDQAFLLSRGWLMPLALTASLWWSGAWPIRAVTTLSTVAVAWFIGTKFAPGYDALGSMLLARLQGLAVAHPDPTTRLMLSVEELSPARVSELAGPAYFSALGSALAIGGLFILVSLGDSKVRSDLARRSSRPGNSVFLLSFAAILFMTVLFSRMKVLAAPLIAVLIGASLHWLLEVRGRSRYLLRAVVMLVAIGAFAWTTWDVWRLMSTRSSAMDPALNATLAHVRRVTEENAVIVAPWELGYLIQQYASRRTIMDGLLESPVTRAQIPRFAQAAMAPSADSLAAFCRASGARWLLVPPSTSLYGIASLVDPLLAAKLLAAKPISPAEADRTIIRMMIFGGPQGAFTEVFHQGGYRLMRLSAAPDH